MATKHEEHGFSPTYNIMRKPSGRGTHKEKFDAKILLSQCKCISDSQLLDSDALLNHGKYANFLY